MAAPRKLGLFFVVAAAGLCFAMSQDVTEYLPQENPNVVPPPIPPPSRPAPQEFSIGGNFANTGDPDPDDLVTNPNPDHLGYSEPVYNPNNVPPNPNTMMGWDDPLPKHGGMPGPNLKVDMNEEQMMFKRMRWIIDKNERLQQRLHPLPPWAPRTGNPTNQVAFLDISSAAPSGLPAARVAAATRTSSSSRDAQSEFEPLRLASNMLPLQQLQQQQHDSLAGASGGAARFQRADTRAEVLLQLRASDSSTSSHESATSAHSSNSRALRRAKAEAREHAGSASDLQLNARMPNHLFVQNNAPIAPQFFPHNMNQLPTSPPPMQTTEGRMALNGLIPLARKPVIPRWGGSDPLSALPQTDHQTVVPGGNMFSDPNPNSLFPEKYDQFSNGKKIPVNFPMPFHYNPKPNPNWNNITPNPNFVA